MPLVSSVIGSRAIGGPPCSPEARISPANGKVLMLQEPWGIPWFWGVRLTSPQPKFRQSFHSPSDHSNMLLPYFSSSRYFGVRIQRLRKWALPSSKTRPWTMPSMLSRPCVPCAVGRLKVGPTR